MAVLETPLNTITILSLLLAMALAIDYSCHIGARARKGRRGHGQREER
jgi:predicted RND superfamily exporter protein